jgi:hypothetical protein
MGKPQFREFQVGDVVITVDPGENPFRVGDLGVLMRRYPHQTAWDLDFSQFKRNVCKVRDMTAYSRRFRLATNQEIQEAEGDSHEKG